MKLLKLGKSISSPEVTHISAHGFWILLASKEYFVPFDQFPWFRDASVGRIMNVQLLHQSHLYWPDLDIDLSTAILEHPEKFRLISK
jgi:hypothetical protein